MKMIHDWSFQRKKRDQFLTNNDFVHPLNVDLLARFIGVNRSIKHRVFTKLNNQQQKRITKAIKVARQLGLLSSRHY